MKRTIGWILPVMCACSGGDDGPQLQGAPGLIDDLAWMAGAWVTDKDPVTEEHWSSPAGGTMMGMNRTISGGRTVHRESLLLETRASHTWPRRRARPRRTS